MREAPGDDGVNNAAIKRMPKKASVKLLAIINACLRLNYFPQSWKNAVIITIPKPGKDHKLPQNHRPISVLTSFSKILERIVPTRLQDDTDRLQLIPSIQFGFRQNHSTTLQALRLAETIHEGYNTKEATAIAYLDTAKAFDKVWHQGLIYKM